MPCRIHDRPDALSPQIYPMQSSEELLRIKAAETDALIIADRALVAACSSCAKGLPADSDGIWDVSQLQLEGQTVQRETVVAWLNRCYQLIHGSPFETQAADPASSIRGLTQLLSFADAVGSSRGLLLALDTDATLLPAQVEVDGTLHQLPLDRCYQLIKLTPRLNQGGDSGQWQLRGFTATSFAEGATISNAVCKDALVQQVIHQVEPLLYLAHKLGLPVLKASVRRMIMCSSCKAEPLLDDAALDSIVSDRVLAVPQLVAPVGSNSKAAMLQSLTMQRLLGDDGVLGSLEGLQRLTTSGNPAGILQYKTTLTDDFLCYKAGQQVTMRLYLDSLQASDAELSVQLDGTERWSYYAVELRMVPWR